MKLPEKKSRPVGTMGLLGLMLVYLVSVGTIHPAWLAAGVFFTLAAIGQENA